MVGLDVYALRIVAGNFVMASRHNSITRVRGKLSVWPLSANGPSGFGLALTYDTRHW